PPDWEPYSRVRARPSVSEPGEEAAPLVERQLAAESRRPLARRPAPAHPCEVDVPAPIELDALGLQHLLLDAGPEPVTMAAAAGRVDHAVPGNRIHLRRPERAERHSDRARAARLPED